MHSSTTTPLALDLMLESLVTSTQFNSLETKNWDSLCRLVPGTTVKQVSRLLYDDICVCMYVITFSEGL